MLLTERVNILNSCTECMQDHQIAHAEVESPGCALVGKTADAVRHEAFEPLRAKHVKSKAKDPVAQMIAKIYKLQGPICLMVYCDAGRSLLAVSIADP